jgi:serine/threonine-protein kinase
VIECESIGCETEAFLLGQGEVFARFDRSHVSGNVGFGVQVGDLRIFAKFAGLSEGPGVLPHAHRAELLLTGARLAREVISASLPRLLNVISTPCGPLVVYEWFSGEVVGVAAKDRQNPTSAFARFKALPLPLLCEALTSVFETQASISDRGWIAGDFYDGTVMYDFEQRRVALVDLDMYRPAPFVNVVGRMFGSSRFMAPEELVLGSTIDERTTVFNMGRCLTAFLSGSRAAQASDCRALHDVERKACAPKPAERFQTMREFLAAWLHAVDDIVETVAG